MNVARDVALAPRTTLGLGGKARRLATVTTVDELEEALNTAQAAGERVLILGGGSNLVISDAGWDGLVIELAMPEVRVKFASDSAIVSAGAGASWDDFVAQMVDANLVGVESLSGIPGKVGATPMQNVGAYGQEVADTIARVTAYDRQTRAVTFFSTSECAFGYRSSKFRGTDRWIILDVQFRFARGTMSAPIAYPELARALGISEGDTIPLGQARSTVIALRRQKGMVVDPSDPDSRSAGSFFTNPIVDQPAFAALQSRLPGVAIPHWPLPQGRIKLSAAWLIERAGFQKGETRGGVGISTKHCLALINRGGGTTAALLALAAEIQHRVQTRFEIDLVREPVVV